MVRFSAAASAALLLLLAAAAGSVDAFLAPQSKVSVSTSASSASTALHAAGGRTLYDKIWDDHVVAQDDSSALIYIDRHLVHEVSLQFEFVDCSCA